MGDCMVENATAPSFAEEGKRTHKSRAQMSNTHVRRTRDLRKRSTDTEQPLRRHLLARQMSGQKFSRRQTAGDYIVDFLCCEKRVIIELDGGPYGIHQEKDIMRDSWLKKQGFRALRFRNNEVFSNTDGALQTVLDAYSGGDGA